LTTDSTSERTWSAVACGGIGGTSGSQYTSSTAGRSAARTRSQAGPSSSGSRTVTASRPSPRAKSAEDTSGSSCDSSNRGAPPIARSSQVTWLRSLLCSTHTTSRWSLQRDRERAIVSSSASPFICIAPSPVSAIAGRCGCANSAPIA